MNIMSRNLREKLIDIAEDCRHDIGAEIYELFVSLHFNKVEFDTFKESFEEKVKLRYPLLKKLCEKKVGELPLSYTSYKHFAGYWTPFNLLGVLSSVEKDQSEFPDNLSCRLDRMVRYGENAIVAFESLNSSGAIFHFSNCIVSFSENKRQNTHSFFNESIARVLGVDLVRKPSSTGKPKKVREIIVEMPYNDYESIRRYPCWYMNIVTSFYSQSLHQRNLEKLQLNLPLIEGFLKPKVFDISLAINRDYRTDRNELNEYQDRAVQTVLECMKSRDGNIPLILGPPGTGKTHTIVTILQNVFQQNNKARVLVCAPSNAAVNVISNRVVSKKLIFGNPAAFTKPGPIFRLGNIEKIGEDLQRFRPKKIGESLKMLESPCLIFSTLNSCQPRQLEDCDSIMRFDLVIIDEAGQSTEIETLMPFVYGCKTIVLVGDPKQLQPTVISQLCANAGYCRSFFERYQTLKDSTNDNSTVELLTQYRMKEIICKFPSSYYYDDQLQTYPGSGKNRKIYLSSLMCHDLVNSVESMQDNSRVNIIEAKFIVEKIINILSHRVKKDYSPSIGVICFYKAQAGLIHEMLNDEELLETNDITVNTVDSFQGQEKDIILISCCRANKERKIGFAYCENRLNVALTRAKSSCLLVVNKATFQYNPMWNALFKFLQKNNRLFHCTVKNPSIQI